MDYRAIINSLSLTDAPGILQRLVEVIPMGREPTVEEELTEEQLEEIERIVRAVVEPAVDKAVKEALEKAMEEAKENAHRKHLLKGPDEVILAFQRHQALYELHDRMRENMQYRDALAGWIWRREIDDPEDVYAECQGIDNETAEIYGGVFESYSDCNMPEGIAELWEEIYQQDIEEWWKEEYMPVYQKLQRAVRYWEERQEAQRRREKRQQKQLHS